MLVMCLKSDFDRSLPLRERGLKFGIIPGDVVEAASLPLRERGLKFANYDHGHGIGRSLPLRERGLK